MKLTGKASLENEFYLYSMNGGGPATYTITDGMLEILHGDQRLEFPYIYNQPSFTVWEAILTEGGEVFLIVSDWPDDEGLYILSFSEKGSNYAIVGEGLTDFLVIDGRVYLLYHEEGIYHTYSDNYFNGYSMYALLKWDIAQNEMVRVLPDELLFSIDDGNSFCYDGKENLYIFYYGNAGAEHGTFCLKYNLVTGQGKHYKVPTYYDGSYYYNDRCFGFDGKGIAEFNSEFDVINYTTLDMVGVGEVTGGYQALAVFKDDQSYRVYQ
ncbi:hypothetical protein PGRAN_09206 [Listeria grandensis FSL F6-0971]|uniref:Uncharacterized protein n=1 Tax=Listeria grandensis FSL F6-0971 TaxID=1265819 RepID=W7BSQ8_9LIST|nr:hypothetical protein [Listeria grandensis]EUJ23338.1 hypothetical protein PGRAN_09206 [Listeria grandensis FSL F6-0971]